MSAPLDEYAQSRYEDAPIFACNAAITEDLFMALHMITFS